MTTYNVTDSTLDPSTIEGHNATTALLAYIVRERKRGIGYDPTMSDPQSGVFLLTDGSRVELVAHTS